MCRKSARSNCASVQRATREKSFERKNKSKVSDIDGVIVQQGVSVRRLAYNDIHAVQNKFRNTMRHINNAYS